MPGGTCSAGGQRGEEERLPRTSPSGSGQSCPCPSLLSWWSFWGCELSCTVVHRKLGWWKAAEDPSWVVQDGSGLDVLICDPCSQAPVPGPEALWETPCAQTDLCALSSVPWCLLSARVLPGSLNTPLSVLTRLCPLCIVSPLSG